MHQSGADDLRRRLQERGRVPSLPPGWHVQSAMVPAEGQPYGGDFLVADVDAAGTLQMVLVDVCGHGATVMPASVQFAGALEGLLVTVPAEDLMAAANAYLLRQPSEESFATAVQVVVELGTGTYRIRSAGHPPALRWSAAARQWEVDNARGTALGVLESPEVFETSGVLAPGEALMFYTDGVVEARGEDIDVGITWLQDAGREAVADGFAGAARAIIDRVRRGEDDRAVLILGRE